MGPNQGKEKKMWEPLGTCQLNSTANPVQFLWNLAGQFQMTHISFSFPGLVQLILEVKTATRENYKRPTLSHSCHILFWLQLVWKKLMCTMYIPELLRM